MTPALQKIVVAMIEATQRHVKDPRLEWVDRVPDMGEAVLSIGTMIDMEKVARAGLLAAKDAPDDCFEAADEARRPDEEPRPLPETVFERVIDAILGESP